MIYSIIAEPPLDVGLVQFSVTLLLPAVAPSPVGTLGVISGVALAEFDEPEVRVVFLAVTVKV